MKKSPYLLLKDFVTGAVLETYSAQRSVHGGKVVPVDPVVPER